MRRVKTRELDSEVRTVVFINEGLQLSLRSLVSIGPLTQRRAAAWLTALAGLRLVSD
jgi:hypothetical protein